MKKRDRALEKAYDVDDDWATLDEELEQQPWENPRDEDDDDYDDYDDESCFNDENDYDDDYDDNFDL